jgi:DNA-directed RNA polymerase II subunit RPB2
VGGKTGVSAVLMRLSYASTLSHLERLNTPVGREGKMAKPRELTTNQQFIMCPCETPEGKLRHYCVLKDKDNLVV